MSDYPVTWDEDTTDCGACYLLEARCPVCGAVYDVHGAARLCDLSHRWPDRVDPPKVKPVRYELPRPTTSTDNEYKP